MASSLEMQDGDLIDLHVRSPILPRIPSTGLIENSPESLLDSELPVFAEKLQTTSTFEVPLEINRNNCVDVEEILISIDDDNDEMDGGDEITKDNPQGLARSNSAILLELCQEENENRPLSVSLENLEALDVLMKLDEILNETLEKSNTILDNCDPCSSNGQQQQLDYVSDEIDKQSIDDCLEDLDNYLRAFDTSGSDYYPDFSSESFPCKFEDSQRSTQSSAQSLQEVPDLDVLSDCPEQLPEESGQVNLAYEDTEGFRVLTRNCPQRATLADIGRERSTFQRTSIKRRSVGELGNLIAPVRISGTGADSDEEVDWNWLREQRTHPPGDCCTGTVVVEPLQRESDQIPETDRHESSWLRTSMRRIRHLRLPSNESPSETDIAASDGGGEMVAPRMETPQCNILQTDPDSARPFSAPSRLATHTNAATQSSVRRSRDSRSRTVSREPGGRARSSSASSRSRRPRSLSSSESSLASSVDTTPSCTPAPTPTRSNQESPASANARR